MRGRLSSQFVLYRSEKEEKMRQFTWTQKLKKLPKWTPYLVFLFLSIGSIYFTILHNQTIFYGDDLSFHLSRIEGLAGSILNGDYFPQINYFLTGGMGYATGIFYPNLFLYPAALFRLTGLSLIQSYVIFILLVNFCTFVIAYHSFLYLHRKKRESFLFAFLYGLSSYRLSDVVFRAAVGEYLAIMLFPFVFVGIYLIIFGDEKKWFLLPIGMALIFFAHLLTAGLVILLIICFLVMNGRGLWREKTRLRSLFFATLTTIPLVAVSLFPMGEQLTFQRLRVQDNPVFYLQKTAKTIGQYLEIGVKNSGYNNLGLLVMGLLLISLLRIMKLSSLGKQLILIALLFFILSTSYFPHWLFHDTIFNMVQLPSRYFLLVTFCTLWAVAENVTKLAFSKPKVVVGFVALLLIGTLISNFHSQMSTMGNGARRKAKYEEFLAIDGQKELGYGVEFLPSGMTSWMAPTGLLSNPSGEGVTITDMKRERNIFTLSYDVAQQTNLIFPLLYYKGYHVEGTGDFSKVHDARKFEKADMHGFLEVTVSGQGELKVWYVGTLIQKVSFGISTISWGFVLIYFIRKRKID